MKNKTLWAVGAVVVVVIIVAAVVMRSGGTSGTSSSGTAAGPGGTPNGPMSMKDLFASGASQSCSFSNNSAEANTTGVVYVTQGHMRGDFTSVASGTASGKTIQSHMITDGQTVYVWTDQPAQGFKMAFASTSASAAGSNTVNPDDKMNYSCNPWTVDQSEFTLPANITFMDAGAMMNMSAGANVGATGAGATGGNAAECSMCAKAPAAAQAQCRAALGCQ